MADKEGRRDREEDRHQRTEIRGQMTAREEERGLKDPQITPVKFAYV